MEQITNVGFNISVLVFLTSLLMFMFSIMTVSIFGNTKIADIAKVIVIVSWVGICLSVTAVLVFLSISTMKF